MKRYLPLALLVALTGLLNPAQAGPFDIEFQELAPGVWAGIRPEGPRFPVMGTSTFVISDEGVVVFDGGGMPIMAEKVIAKIRTLTKADVTHVIISHWHGDHNFGNYRYAEEFPNVQFVAHRFTHAVMNASRIRYVDNYPGYIEKNLPKHKKRVETGFHDDGAAVSVADRSEYERIIEFADELDVEFQRPRVTSPNLVFDEMLTIYSGDRRIELLRLGHGNTDGDIVMWLPDEKIVATGDLVVMPTPYAFNVPPRPWAAALTKLNELNYDVLVPGHGAIQNDTRYVDLNIEAANSIADQRDEMLERGMSPEEIEAALDFSGFEKRFTGGDELLQGFYEAYFEKPFRKAAIKALSGEPMVTIERPEK